jgi:beta-glucosidase
MNRTDISGVDSALAGLDMSMPGDTMIPLFGNSYWKYELTRAVLNGSVPLDRLNDMATRIVATWYKLGQDKDYPRPNFSANTKSKDGLLYPGSLSPPWGQVNWFVNVQEDHHLIARQVAQDGTTLIKNYDNLLPLPLSARIKVFGTGAAVNPDGANACLNKACNKGTLGMGWGSGVAEYPYFDDPISALRRRASNTQYYDTDSYPNPPTNGTDAAIVFISSDSGENTFTVEDNHGDRDNSRQRAWNNGDELVRRVAENFENVIVVVHTVGPINLEPWIELPNVKSVLFAHLPGQEAGEGLARILYGDVSPSGHLPYSITYKETDLPDSIANLRGFAFGQVQDTYSEGLYIDYRWLNKKGIKPRYAFGHGLSYTTFDFSAATIKSATPLTNFPPPREPKGPVPVYSDDIPPASEAYAPVGFKTVWRYLYSWLPEKEANEAHAIGFLGKPGYAYPAGYSQNQTAGPESGGGEGGNPALWDTAYELTVTIRNMGRNHSGRAVAQAYVQFPPGIPYDTPIVQLRDFAKTKELAPGGV